MAIFGHVTVLLLGCFGDYKAVSIITAGRTRLVLYCRRVAVGAVLDGRHIQSDVTTAIALPYRTHTFLRMGHTWLR